MEAAGVPRAELLARKRARQGWLLVATGLLIPLLALGAVYVGTQEIEDGRRPHGVALVAAGLLVFGARLWEYVT